MPPPPPTARGTLVEHPPVSVVSFDLGSLTGGATFRLFGDLQGSLASVSLPGVPITQGMMFTVTVDCLFSGYWWWVCPSGQPTIPVSAALWQATALNTGTLLPAGNATSGS